MVKLQALFILCMVTYCLGQGFGGNEWQDELAMEEAAAAEAASGLSMPLLSATADESSKSVYGSMQDGTGAMYGTKPDGTFYSSGQDGSGTVYGKGHHHQPTHQDGTGNIQHSDDNGYGEESSGDQYNYEEEVVKDYGDDVYVETDDDEAGADQGKVVFFDVGKKQAEIDRIIIENSEEAEDYHEQFEDIVGTDYSDQKNGYRKDEFEDTKSSDTSGESRFLTPIHFRRGSGGAAAGGGSEGGAVVSSEVPKEVRIMQLSKKVEFSCNQTKKELGDEHGDEYMHDIDWKHNGVLLDTTDRISLFTNGTVVISAAEEGDLGNYTCYYGDTSQNELLSRTYTLIMLSYKKLPTSGVTAIEGEDMSLTCEVEGKPEPKVTWYKGNVVVQESIDLARFNLSRKDEKYPEDSTFTLFDIKKDDRSEYKCCFSNYQGFELCTATNVRVKDIYAALWPFLGIVLEVVILCLIIFIYEKRRTKNDFEESDTDQGTNSCRKDGPN